MIEFALLLEERLVFIFVSPLFWLRAVFVPKRAGVFLVEVK
jgi:hypothetical protein